MLKLIRPTENSIFKLHNPLEIKLHRNGLSHLKERKFEHNIQEFKHNLQEFLDFFV